MGVSARNRSKVFDPLNRVRMTEGERRAAREYMAQGETVADFITGAISVIRFFVHAVERRLRTRGRRTSAHR